MQLDRDSKEAKTLYQDNYEAQFAETLAQMNLMSQSLFEVRDSLLKMVEDLKCLNSTSLLVQTITKRLKKGRSEQV